jgi:rubrerythrin
MKTFRDVNDILDFAINAEQESVDFYTQLAQKVSNEEMKKVFVQFAGEEMGHKARLTNIKLTSQFALPIEKITDLKIADYMLDVKPSPDMSYQDALILAMNKEKKAFRLYFDLSAKTDSNDLRALFMSLAVEESKHKLRFEIEYDDYVLKEN